MAKIKLVASGFTLIPEGWHTFKITEVEYKEDFGKMVVNMTTQDGKKHQERFGLLTKAGEVNEGALKAFSYFAKTALGNFDLEEIDEDDLVGCYMKAKVEHVTSETISDRTGEPFINVNLVEKEAAYGFKDVKGGSAKAEPEAAADDEDVDVDDFLD